MITGTFKSSKIVISGVQPPVSFDPPPCPEILGGGRFGEWVHKGWLQRGELLMGRIASGPVKPVYRYQWF